MNRWRQYFFKQFPLWFSFVLGSGITLSGIFLNKGLFHFWDFLFSLIGVFLFFITTKLIEDVKNIDKDRILHKHYPLVQKIIKKDEALRLIKILQITMFSYAVILFALLYAAAALTYAAATFYVWAMNKEFGMEKFLSKYRFLDGLLHQIAVVPIALFAATIPKTEALIAPATWSFAAMLLGAFFCYDLCRRLNPQTHPVLATYIHFYGFRRTYEIAVISLALSASGAILLHLGFLVIPWELVVLATLSLLFFQMSMYRFPEAAALISLLVHVWGVFLARTLQV